MRISDWSSDVCSSDLRSLNVRQKLLPLFFRLGGRHCGGRSNRCDSGLNGHLSRSCGLGINAKMEALEGVEDERLDVRSEEHTSELQSLMRSSYAVFCLKKKNSIQSKCPIHNTTVK